MPRIAPPAPLWHTARQGNRLLPPWLLLWLWLALLPLQGLAADTPLGPIPRPGNGSAGSGPDSLPTPSVEELRKRLEAIPQKLREEDDGRRLVAEASAIGAAAERLAAQRSAELADLDARLEGLGPAPDKGAPGDAPDVVQQRASLTRQRAALDSELKLARLVSVDASQRANELTRQRHAQFQAALSSRTDSPLSAAFWRNLRNASAGDRARLQSLATELATAVASATQPARRPAFLGSVLLALALATVAPWALQRLLLRLLPAHLPATRLRRSLLAALAIGANVLLVAAALQAAWAALAAGQPPSELLRALEHASIRAGAYAAFVISLGNALLARRRPSWRLLPLSDAQARRLAPYPWWIALLSAAGALAGDLNALLGVSLSAEVFTHALAALLLSLALAAFLARTRRRVVRVAQPAATEPAAPLEAAVQMEVRPLWLGVVLAAAALAVLAALLGLALGYVALAGMLARQTVWSGVVFATTYLLCLLAEDLSEALLSSQGMVGRHLHTALGLEPRLLDQLAVLASGALRVLLLFYMAIALMAPFGTGPDELFRRGSLQGGSLKIGDFVLAPQSLATAVAVLVAGFMAIRMLKRWLAERYFPNTALEPGMQSSITTLLGYIGGVVVIAIALAGLGISVERIAWVASALSVGIGFGLQAIVQNFISGLILLAERPVRVGDWVVLGDTEGDVRRINVRATEIQQWDRSTVIVPNSEFITKTVRNVTLTGAQGRLMLRLPAPLTTDAQRMRELILAAFQAHEAVLDDPAPVVQLEGIQNGTLTFLAIGWVASPRQVGGVRSDLLFAILEALRREGLQLSPPATTLVTPEAPLLDERAAAGQPPADAAG
ncbi:small-conductance mechanosensitive channel [Melaminivora alkalimesophila]|uniref:Small-conductance mechanosensitive channel n=2 Tax=Melaminivora alkalimesophila TaxID=1165852 RepID=A0A317RFM6_9BURK|nr:DUF3772 domain-containing protein [Melaminivora alkalimesophila]PWW48623.1 small-conductance mechanosensitive channel [Melaminivora alkalimesophila]